MNTDNKFYTDFKNKMAEIADLQFSVAILSWDQETYMPKMGTAARARQVSTLAALAHKKFTDADLGKILSDLSQNNHLAEGERINIQRTLKDYNKSIRIPNEYVKELNETTGHSFLAWHEAKEKNDFSIFRPWLDKIFNLKIREAEYLGYKESPYNALLDLYEPETKVKDLAKLFKDVRKQLAEFAGKIFEKTQNHDSFMKLKFPRQQQWDFGIQLLKQMNYDFDRGRQDIAPHPFTTTFSTEDVRVTTRINENDPREMIFSCIHEGGHALYEQGLPRDQYGLPLGTAVSLGIHESQSRLWENHVGRSYDYWKANAKLFKKYFPKQLKGKTAEDIYRAVNIVKPSFIRTAADEITYHFHVALRFEIEKGLIEKQIQVKDLPSVWNNMMKEILNVKVPDNRVGVLQDIHWSFGNIGYFPTYSLGSFYAAQFFNKAQQEIKGLTAYIAKGNLKPLLDWLRDRIHRHGRFYTAEELCIKATGEKLDFRHFMNYSEKKYGELYNL